MRCARSRSRQTTGYRRRTPPHGNASINFSFTATGQDAYIVTSYIRSRAIVDDLSRTLNLREIFRRPEADFWARLKRNASIDELTDYWNGMVNTYIDAPSGIVTLRVRAFRAEDAVALAKAVLSLSENLVNRISDRARSDAMEQSEEEVRRGFQMTQTALADLRQFRDNAGIIDPVQATTEIGKLLIPLMTEKIRLESDLFVASRDLDSSAPTVKALKNRLDTTEKQIADLKGKLTSTERQRQNRGGVTGEIRGTRTATTVRRKALYAGAGRSRPGAAARRPAKHLSHGVRAAVAAGRFRAIHGGLRFRS